jgi:PEP-CTERM motif
MDALAFTSRFIAVATFGVLCACTGMASTIPVLNFSFELLPLNGLPLAGCGAGCAYNAGSAAIPNWTSAATSGEFQPGTPATPYFHSLPAGPTIAYSNGATLSQAVGTVQPGLTYTFLVDLGRRTEPTLSFSATADLLINGNRVLAKGSVPAPGNWSTFTATYISLPQDLGKTITIELRSSGPQADFDDVRLSSSALSATPEPAAVTLLGLGLVGLSVFARRKRAS